MNEYYVLIDYIELYGPYTFNVALREQKFWMDFSGTAIILKEVIDNEGKEVK